MPVYEPFVSIALSLAIGLLIGLQREQAARSEGEKIERFFVGGIRTYPLFALAGSLSALLAGKLGVWIIGVVFAALMVPPVLAYIDDIRKERDRGITSEIAFVVTFLLGVFCSTDNLLDPPSKKYLVASSIAVAMTALLSLKVQLHTFAERISLDDVYATLKFLVLAVIVLPLLPNQVYGPLDVLNPFQIGLMIVLMAGIGFVGYVAIRLLGPGRGLGLTGMIGGLVSSTAVTLSSAAYAKREPKVSHACALAVVLASSVMVLRIMIAVSAVYAPLLPFLAWPVIAMLVAGLISALILYKFSSPTESAPDVDFKNPFEISTALKFGFVFALVLFISKAASIYLGNGGIYLAALLAGLTDMDAITLSLAAQARDGLDPKVATTGILIGTASNTLVKAFLAISLGGWLMGRKVAFSFAAMLIAGGAAIAFYWLR